MSTTRMNQRGQGLLEAIIGIGVIIAGTVGTVTLIMATIKAGRSTNNQVVAASLAREGIEVVRNLRDTNWLRIQANEDTDLAAPGLQPPSSFEGIFSATDPKHDAIPVMSVSTSSWTIERYTPGPASCGGAWDCSQVYQAPPSTRYFQDFASATLNRQPTRFKRTIRLNPICRVDASPADGIPDVPATETIANGDGAVCPVIPAITTMVGLQVLSKMTWDEGGSPKSFQLEARLYNWKYVK